jgi:predicted dehydrogenase
MTLRIGILGAARVATYALIDAAHAVDGVTAHAVAARDPARASAYAAEHGIPVIYPDYQTLIDADDVDAVYVALPPSLHARWSIAALRAGKPVLCEKPFALSVADVEDMLSAEAAAGVLLMEAQHTHYHPINIRARDVMRSGVLGIVHSATARFDAPVPEVPGEIRWDGPVGGGALWDLGVYPAYWLRSLIGAEPEVVSAWHDLVPSGADMRTEAMLRFPGEVTAQLLSDMTAPIAAEVMIEGSDATLHIANPLLARLPQSLTLTVGGKERVETFPDKASFAYQLEVFRDAVLHGGPVATRGDDSLATICLLSAIRAAAETKPRSPANGKGH